MNFSLKAIDLRLRSRLLGLSDKFIVRKRRFFGKEWSIPVVDYMGYGIALGVMDEHWIYNEVKALMHTTKISTFVDIGANIGQTLIKVKSLDPDIDYYGFEPNPNCVFYLNSLIRLNGLINVSVHCLGLGARLQIADFHYAGKDDVCGTFNAVNSAGNKLPITVSLPVWPLDEIPFTFDEQDGMIVKIDVEGFENEVLQGATTFISRYRPFIIIELLPHQQNHETQARAESVFSLIREWNYNAYQIQRTGGRKEIINLPDNADNFDEVDYLFVPNANSISGN